jgi:hypothetical protein
VSDQEFVNLIEKRLEMRLARAVNPLTDEQEEVARRRARRRKKNSGMFEKHVFTVTRPAITRKYQI